jgi:predicted O-linked N-acetylglucosamine transferase (SPINDLY family)
VARQRHLAGDLDGAEPLYRQALLADPGHADAWHGLGLLASQRGHPDRALELYAKALALKPDVAAYHLNRGVACHALGRLEDALASFKRAVDLKPDFAQAHNNLANVLSEQGHTAQALTHWHKALELQPDYAEAQMNLGHALHDQGKFADAAASYRQALRLQPHAVAAHFGLGNALAELKEYEAAATSFLEALRCQPGFAEAYGNLGHVLRKQGKLAEAVERLREALRLKPDLAEAHNELGAALGSLGQPEDAFRHLGQALYLQPDHVEANNNLGVLLKGQRRWDEAIARFRHALKLRPDLIETSCNLASTFCRQGRLDEAVACLKQALARQPDAPAAHCVLAEALADRGQLAEAAAGFREALRLEPKQPATHSCLLIAFNMDPASEPASLLAEHRQWAKAHAQVTPLEPDPAHDRDPNRRLRVGYVSQDLHRHVLAHFVEPILAHRDPRQVEVFCYADVLAPDAVTARLRSLSRHWRSICGLADEEVARLVREDKIDLLVDLGGHLGTRLGVFALKSAPVQVSYLGYPNTTGVEAIAYRLTDAVSDPAGEPNCHTEELVRLPGGFCCYQPLRDAPDVAPSPWRATGRVTFGSLHKLAKLNGGVLDVWCAVLRAVPDSRLLIFRDSLRGEARERLGREFAQRGLGEDRVLLKHEVKESGTYLEVYREIDVLLDVFPWSGHATACEALWMGVPVLTLYGNRHAGRMVASVLTQLGLTDLIARSPEEYVAAAVRLAGDRNGLAELRRLMRDRMLDSPLCDGATFTRQLEEAYRAMWRRWVETAEQAPGEPTAPRAKPTLQSNAE